MKLLLYFYYTIAVLAIITFTYDLVKLGTFNWSSLAITLSIECRMESWTHPG